MSFSVPKKVCFIVSSFEAILFETKFELTVFETKKASRYKFRATVKLVYNDHPWDPKFVAIVDRWSFFRGSFTL